MCSTARRRTGLFVKITGMDKERDLLPWILGGVLLTTVAAAVDLVATEQPAAAPPASRMAVAQSMPRNPTAPGANSLASPVTASAAAASVTPAPPANHIWECNIGGRRVFADSPCGANASIRELSPMNTMAASNPVPVYYSSPSPLYPASSPGYREEPDPSYEQPDSQQLGAVYYYNGVARRHRPPRHGDHGARAARLSSLSTVTGDRSRLSVAGELSHHHAVRWRTRPGGASLRSHRGRRLFSGP